MTSLAMNKFLLLTALSGFYCKINAFDGEDESRPIVEVKQGLLRGFKEESLNGKEFYSFLGIPFAKPPVGDLRFRDPVNVTPWSEILEANKETEPCLQNDMLQTMLSEPKVSGKEDCLYLDVFTPKPNKPEEKLPVMVYIHGGAFLRGGADIYRPYALLNERIVLVVTQYRLGIFGFMSTEDKIMPGNLGIKDQIMALKWVKENIRNFGGDPDRVTIFGESAGGASVHILMISPVARGLFHGVIAQSGTALCPWINLKNHKRFAKAVGREVGCSLDLGTESFIKCLQGIDPQQLLKYTTSTVKFGISPLYTTPRVDGYILPDDPEVLLREGRYNKVNLITGVTRDEGAHLLCYLNSEMEKELKEEFKTNGPILLYLEDEEEGANTAEKIFANYLHGEELDLQEHSSEMAEIFSDHLFKNAFDLASALHCQDEDISLYRYELTHKGQLSLLDYFDVEHRINWISHGDDLFYLFSGGKLFSRTLERKEDQMVRNIFTKLWANFARTGNPTPDGSLNFTWHQATADKFEHLDITPNPAMAKDQRQEIRQFYRSLPTRQNKLLFPDGNSDNFWPKRTTGKNKEEL